MKKDHPINNLVTQQLVEVDFVLDYIRLRFESTSEYNFLTFLTDPIVISNGISYEKAAREFSYNLINMIDSQVISLQITENEKMEITFEDERKIIVSLKSEDYVSSEAVTYENSKNEWDAW